MTNVVNTKKNFSSNACMLIKYQQSSSIRNSGWMVWKGKLPYYLYAIMMDWRILFVQVTDELFEKKEENQRSYLRIKLRRADSYVYALIKY